MVNHTDFGIDSGIAVLTVTNPPTNALTATVRADLAGALKRALADDSVTGVVLAGAQGQFPCGADLSDPTSGADLSLGDLCTLVEDASKPVVAALEGTVYGGGLELALACHARVATQACRISLPEVRIGLPPSAGGSQRLPRLVGAETALDLLLSGKIVSASHAALSAMFDAMVAEDPVTAARELSARIASGARPMLRTGDRRDGFSDPMAYTEVIIRTRKSLAQRHEPVADSILQLVEAAPMLPLPAGLALEADLYSELLTSDTARALRHGMFAERAAARFALPAGTELPRIDRLAVLGGGPLAVQIVLSALNAGLQVNWGTRDPARLAEGLDNVRQVFEKGVKGGGLLRATAEHRLARLSTGDSAAMVDGADMVVHAARGQSDIPTPPDMVRAVAVPGKVHELGLRFSPPIFATRLCEVLQGPRGSAPQVAAGLALARRLGKVAVQVRSGGDSAAGRLFNALHRAADALVDAGADPYDIDTAMRQAGWTKPVFQSRDTVGFEEMARTSRAPGAENWSRRMLEAGRKGWVEGLGFYIWENGAPKPDIEVSDLLDSYRPPKHWQPEDLLRLINGAMANEGARMLREGMLQRAGDVDVVAMLGLDYPRQSGGPMMAAGLAGMFATKRALERFDHPDRLFWDPEPVWAELVKNGRTFTGA